MSPWALADQTARDRIRGDLATTLVVEAAAGTGKTTALVGRLVAVVRAGVARLDQIVAVTFTEAAAGELKLRLRGEIERARQDPAVPDGERARLASALEQLEAARIGTIHAFCADLLRERPVEAGVDPQFHVAPEEVAGGVLDRVFDRWFERTLADPGEGVRRALRCRTRTEDGPRARLRSAAAALVAWRDFPTPWRREPFAREGEIDEIVAEMTALGDAAVGLDPEDWFAKSLRELDRFAREVARRERVAARDHDRLEAELVGMAGARHWNWRGYSRGRAREGREALRDRRAVLHERVRAFARRAGMDLAPALRDELWPVVAAYDDAKMRAGQLDFLDLLLRTRDLVRDQPHVRRELQVRFTHLFVDEFQDTDPLQAELLLLLAAADPAERDWTRIRPVPGKLFVVGDPKQSIYRFRRADVALYQRVKTQLLGAGAELVHLTVSFRAVPELQEAVNAAFAPAMGGDSPSQAAYVPLDPARARHPAQPPLVALPVPKPYGDYGRPVDFRIAESLPDAVGAFVRWLVEESGWTVAEGAEPDGRERRVAIRPRHVCILFRRLRTHGVDVTRPYVRALEARYVPHVLVGGSSFHAREEVEALRTALVAIERPDDDLAVFATLRGPLFALSDGELLAWRARCGSLHPFRKPPADLPPPLGAVADALTILRRLHRERNRRPIAQTVSALLAAVRAHAGLAIWPAGEQALANVARVMDLGRRAERQGITSFRAFVEQLAAEAERGEAGDAPIVEEGTEGVRVMTVHKAKGLEFPVVILADLTCSATPGEPARHVDATRGLCVQKLCGASPPELVERFAEEGLREAEEAARLLYVAATRARDLLVVPALGDAPPYVDGWLSLLDPVVYPPAARAHTPEVRSPVGCPPFGRDTVLARPARVVPAWSVAPGEHTPTAGPHRVVWWDPAVLLLDVQESVGLRQQKLLQADESGRRSDAGIAAHAAWQARRRAERARAGVPARTIVRPTDPGAGGEAAAAADVPIVELPVRAGRPGGPRFGELVHRVVATVDLGADRTAVAALASAHGRLLGAEAAEVDAAVEAAWAALAHPLLRRAATAKTLRRECPIALRLDDGTLVEGEVDAAFEDPAGWTVIDFKTDVDLTPRLTDYRRQVGLYVRAVAAATGRPARGVLLRV